MSKNLTRKGLALGVVAALAGSFFTGVPASAAANEQLTLLPSTGTAYKTIEGEAFALTEGLLPGSSQPISNTTTLKYSVTNMTPTSAAAFDTGFPKVNGKALGATAATDTLARTAVSPSVQPANTTVYSEGTTPVAGANQTFTLKVTGVATGVPSSFAVTAFFDVDGDNVYDEGLDPASATRTITWVDDADVAGTVALSQPYVGDTSATATVVLDGYNQEQLAAHKVAVHFTDASGTALKGVTASTSASATDIVLATLATGKFSATSPTFTALVRPATASASGSVKASAYIRPSGSATAASFAANANGATTFVADAKSLGSSFFAAEIRTYDSVVTSTAWTANSLAYTSTAATTGAVNQTLAVANTRVNSEVSVSAALSKVAVAQPNASISLKVTTAVTLSATKTLTLAGKTYTANADLPTALALTSNADGNAIVTFTTAGFEVGNAVVLEFKGQGLTNTVTVTSAALVYDIYETKNVLASNERSMNLGSTLKLGYKVVDQFKEAITSGYRLRLTATNGTGTPLTVSPAYFEGVLTGGTTEFTVGNAAVGVYTAAVVLQKYNASTLLWDDLTGGGTNFTAPASVNVNVIAVQKDVVGISQAAGEDSEVVADVVETANDTRVSRATSKVYAAGERASLSILVSEDITDIGRKGAEVTVTGSGLLFGKTSAGYEVADSFTAYANASGVADVDVISNIEGTYTITVTSGAASKTATVTFVSTLPTASIAWKDAPAQMVTQRTFEQTVITKDKYGNLVGDAIAFTNTGVGYFVINSVTTDEVTGEGTARFGNWLNEIGLSNLLASYATGVVATPYVLSPVHSVDWGITDVTDISSAGKAIYVNTEYAKGKVVTVYINGKKMPVKAAEATDNAVERKYTQRKAGTYTVTVRISGGIIASEKVVIK